VYFQHTITIPANTSQESPIKDRFKVSYGMVGHVDIFFIPDCAGLVGVRILHHGSVAFPTGGDGWFIRNEDGPKWDDEYLITTPPLELEIEGYNEDDTYDHKIQVGCSLLRRTLGVAIAEVQEDVNAILEELTE